MDGMNYNAKKRDGLTDSQAGLVIDRVFSTEGVHPFDEITWKTRSAKITDGTGDVIFEQNDVEVPATWTQLATNVVVSKYFYGQPDTDEREHSVKQLVHRVAKTIADWGKQDNLFANDADADAFYSELASLCANQYGAFNSPTWFNVGLYHVNGVSGSGGNYHWDFKAKKPLRTDHHYQYPQSSACFIQSVDDTMEDIMRLATDEAMLFKFGSGTGTDLSTLRSSREKLTGGGQPSGPLSFMRIYDQVAAVVRSGGKTRRAAKMQSLRCDHPDIREFIECKMREERKAWSLIEQGWDGSFNGEAYGSVMYQNANLSIRLTDDFMQAALEDGEWQTYAVTTGEPIEKHKARELLHLIAEGTHVCGDPGVQYHSIINKWHTCSASGEIKASNPCSEYMFINDSACNLASLNLLKFRREDGSFDIEKFQAAVRIFIIAQEILVDHSSYPSERITQNSHEFRPLGLGYANLGALLISLGLPYDSDQGRAIAGAITSILCGTAYTASAEIASRTGAFEAFDENRQQMLDVMEMHRNAVDTIDTDLCDDNLIRAAKVCWNDAIVNGRQFGYRNAQTTVLAPTGTIGFMMDCDTTGIEPDIALVKYKQLAGGGLFKLVNRTVPLGLKKLGYSEQQIKEIVDHIDENDTIEGNDTLDPKHLSVFDCAFKPAKGKRCIHHMGHIKMMSAAQPFLSGAISKTVNIPHDSDVDEIMDIYIEGWKMGLKAVAIYRDGSKRTQPLNVTQDETADAEEAEDISISVEQFEQAKRTPHRHRLPATRRSITHKFDVAGHEGYLNVGLYENGEAGELFITMAKEGSTVGGMMDAFATSVSLCLQYGVPLEALVQKFTHQRFEPSGMTSNRDIPFAKSIVDYIFRWMGLTFLEDYRKENLPNRPSDTQSNPITSWANKATTEAHTDDMTSAQAVDESLDTDVTGSIDATMFGSYKSQNQTTSLTSANGNGNGKTPQTAIAGTYEGAGEMQAIQQSRRVLNDQFSAFQEDAPACDNCGAITVRNGNCYKCFNCGSSLGCS